MKTWAQDHTTGYMQEWNFTLEGEVLRNTVLRASYVGNKGTHLDRNININDPVPAPGNIRPRRPYQPFGTIAYRESGRNSVTEQLQLGARRRFAAGLSFQIGIPIHQRTERTAVRHYRSDGQLPRVSRSRACRLHRPSCNDRELYMGSAVRPQTPMAAFRGRKTASLAAGSLQAFRDSAVASLIRSRSTVRSQAGPPTERILTGTRTLRTVLSIAGSILQRSPSRLNSRTATRRVVCSWARVTSTGIPLYPRTRL